ncbi:MAG: hypothetical protein AAFV78_11205, partial [Bacteroidota bacterium]
IINAQDISLEYGVPPQLVYGLLNVYEQQKLKPKQRLQAVQNLLGEYNTLKKTGREIDLRVTSKPFQTLDNAFIYSSRLSTCHTFLDPTGIYDACGVSF